VSKHEGNNREGERKRKKAALGKKVAEKLFTWERSDWVTENCSPNTEETRFAKANRPDMGATQKVRVRSCGVRRVTGREAHNTKWTPRITEGKKDNVVS